MNSRDFAYWLQGYFEIAGTRGAEVSLNPEQVALIQKHLNMVFFHEIDPSYGDSVEGLSAIHAGAPTPTPTPTPTPEPEPAPAPAPGSTTDEKPPGLWPSTTSGYPPHYYGPGRPGLIRC